MSTWSINREMRLMKDKKAQDQSLYNENMDIVENWLTGKPWPNPPGYNGQELTAATRLIMLAQMERNLAATKIIEGDATGWTNMKIAMRRLIVGYKTRFDDWENKIQRKGRSGLTANDTTLDLTALVAFDLESECRLLCGLLSKNWDDGNAIFPPYSGNAVFCSFALALASVTGEDQLIFARFEKQIKQSVYSNLFNVLRHENSDVSNNLLQFCDYHIEQSVYKKGESSLDIHRIFAEGFYPIFPVEILGILQVRRKFGLRTTLPTHPLLESPLSNPPEDIRSIPDPFLERFKKRAEDLG